MASIYSQFYNLAALLGPVIGGAMYDWTDYEFTMNFHIFLEIGVALLFICFNCGRKVYAKHTIQQDVLKKLKEIED